MLFLLLLPLLLLAFPLLSLTRCCQVLCVLAGVGFGYLGEWVCRHALPRSVSRRVLGTAAACAVVAALVGSNFHARNESANTAVADMGRALLNGLPEVRCFAL